MASPISGFSAPSQPPAYTPTPSPTKPQQTTPPSNVSRTAAAASQLTHSASSPSLHSSKPVNRRLFAGSPTSFQYANRIESISPDTAASLNSGSSGSTTPTSGMFSSAPIAPSDPGSFGTNCPSLQMFHSAPPGPPMPMKKPSAAAAAGGSTAPIHPKPIKAQPAAAAAGSPSFWLQGGSISAAFTNAIKTHTPPNS